MPYDRRMCGGVMGVQAVAGSEWAIFELHRTSSFAEPTRKVQFAALIVRFATLREWLPWRAGDPLCLIGYCTMPFAADSA